MEKIEFNGWKNSVRLANSDIELIVTTDVGPRIIRFGYINERNLFAEMDGQQGGSGEDEWMIRGGHRLWVAPEQEPTTYELDNSPVDAFDSDGGVRIVQEKGALSHVRKEMILTLGQAKNAVTVRHILVNEGEESIDLAPWALSVMAPGGMAVIPLPANISHSERLTHNQEWSLWGYTDLSDDRWMIGSEYIFLRQDSRRGPTKLGIAHREKWAAYILGEFAFFKFFNFREGARYPDGGVNCEVYTEQEFLEIESLGPMTQLAPGKSVEHVERWVLAKGVKACASEGEANEEIRPIAESFCRG